MILKAKIHVDSNSQTESIEKIFESIDKFEVIESLNTQEMIVLLTGDLRDIMHALDELYNTITFISHCDEYQAMHFLRKTFEICDYSFSDYLKNKGDVFPCTLEVIREE